MKIRRGSFANVQDRVVALTDVNVVFDRPERRDGRDREGSGKSLLDNSCFSKLAGREV